MAKKYDVAVLGGGPGGYVAAIRASQLGLKTVVIDKDNLGGICLNWGCIPTKALLKNVEVLEKLKHAADFGIRVDGYSVDFAKIIKRSRDIADRISKNVEYLMKKNKIDRLRGFGRLTANDRLIVATDAGKTEEEIEAGKIIIATGARPRELPQIPIDREYIITSTEAMSLKSQPKEMIIIGAGAIGIEFAYFYNALGTKVTVVEVMDNILPIEDTEISQALQKEMKKQGITFFTSTMVEKAEVRDGKVEVQVKSRQDEVQVLRADLALSAIGVTGNVEGFGLEELGVELYARHIKVDKSTYETSVKGIFAIGDVIGPPWLAHVASAEGIYCIEKIKGLNPPLIDYDSIPGCTYCQPQVASVGLTERKAKENGYELKIGKFPFMASGKAFAIGEREGFVKVIFDAKYGELLGAHIIGPEATELIAEFTLAKTMEATYESIIKTVHAHPTLSEAVAEASAGAYEGAIHI
ncbi:MAG: dihydrolipoyl dehydrogenase [Ignavibacteria bacterium]|jgi:dihydrolipoamide dehydrogenase|nr:dihydrolipoyl dehydrogenase [Ignavibacteria bacterium]MCU7501593.1 dihydrolipoyl dehydrogenase [Ignavibacteria bacterium]MCU7517130.1 dihydrolipoyl dehydrogenase [Ignavibacteria bacterium]